MARRPWTAPRFPQPVPSFAGRRVELERMLAHVDADVLFLIYGVAGIGKTELAYQLIRELRAQPRWAEAVPLLVDVRPGMTASRVLAQLLAGLGSPSAPRRAQVSDEAYLSSQLALLARMLDARPCLLFIDDVHHLSPAAVGEALGFLARHVEKSRIVVASRREVPLPAQATPPVITTLGPLDETATAEMTASLAERLQLPRPEPELLWRSTRGSPFLVHRMLVRRAPEGGGLESSLDELTPAAHRLLLAAAVAQSWPTVAALHQLAAWPGSLEGVLRELEQRFLLDIKDGRVVVHDLVREALLGRVAPHELSAAHEDAAALCLAALDEGDRRSLLSVVDAIGHHLAAGRCEEAWSLVERFHSPLAASRSEHLLVEPLDRLRAELPARRVAIDLLSARCLVRASLFEEAGRVLARVAEASRSDEEEARYCILAGEVAQRAGDLARAEAMFERAVARAPDGDARFQAQLRMASAAIFAGERARARGIVDTALAELPSPSSRQRARAGWARTVSLMFDECFEEAAAEARRTRETLGDGEGDDLVNQLAMLETLAAVENEDMERAREAARVIEQTGLRSRVAALYRAIVHYADGSPREASVELLAAAESMRAHGDTMSAYLAGYFGAAALVELGELGRAEELAGRTAQLAERAGLRAPAARSRAQQALLAAEALRSAEAHRLADVALASGQLGPRSRALAHCAHAQAFTSEGDITRALEHLAEGRAAVAAPEHAAAQARLDIEHAAIELVGGNLEHAVARGERAVAWLRGRRRDYEAGRAGIVLAAAYIARGRRTDLLFAERTVTEARELADRGALRSIQVGCAILSAALARRENRELAARELLADALRRLDPQRGSVYADALMAAIDGDFAARAMPGVVALLAHLGFRETVECYLVDQHGRRAATERDVARERELRELFVDESRGVIVARRGEVEVAGRPTLCALLSVVVQARGKAVSPETLYKRAWGAAEYHALHHRNAVYVAINRLRKILREALPDRTGEVIARAPNGWRLADDVDACVALAVRQTM